MSHVPSTDATVEPKPLDIQPLDIQHDTDPAEDHGIARRIPHLGHTLLFYSLTASFVFFWVIVTASALSATLHVPMEAIAKKYAIAGLAAQGVGYGFTLLASAWLFPRLWRRSFLHGIQWNVLAAHRYWPRLLVGGVLMSACAQAALHLTKLPQHADIDNMFLTPAAAWFTALFGVLVAPAFEEIAFRGFFLPALATAYDWLALERTPAGLERWQRSTLHSTTAVIFAAVLSSIPFALLHAPQIGMAWGAVGVLYGVSLLLSAVRIRTHSVACSALMHATYNFTIFLGIFISTSGFRHLNLLQ
jgi:membrane protease YdiL (CAAX protease family)